MLRLPAFRLWKRLDANLRQRRRFDAVRADHYLGRIRPRDSRQRRRQLAVVHQRRSQVARRLFVGQKAADAIADAGEEIVRRLFVAASTTKLERETLADACGLAGLRTAGIVSRV